MPAGNYATIQPARRFGLYSDPFSAWLSDNPPAVLYRLGAALRFVAGLIVEAALEPTTILGFAADPATSTGSFTTAIGATTYPAVGAGVAKAGIERRFYPAGMNISFVGTLDTSATGTRRPLVITDVGTSIGINPIDPTSATAAVLAGGKWILDTAATTNKIATVIRLIDPIGATSGDTPIAGINSGQALVEFVISQTATAYVGPVF